ncbi:hypothetical protein C7974DRAFT_430475 [Boeremia exigua]|uniref:uncharacterized protein n=1 Tax=Boeremia exigua TaxID=749465 RepID=UPI001E8E7ED4|nr:uncharacterized protein C7974DRAFT_430475 [Boeremia exigua]KAH6644793.1 hypothetical protein C7974DRAFT_430475 [Boeremia exigua]
MFEDIDVPTLRSKKSKRKVSVEEDDSSVSTLDGDDEVSDLSADTEDMDDTLAEGAEWLRAQGTLTRRRTIDAAPSSRTQNVATGSVIISSSPSDSIWLPLPEETFRQHLLELEKRTNAVPIDPQTFPLKESEKPEGYMLPLQVEQQLADDFAFLAAIEEGAQSVAAVCLEEHVQPIGLTVRFAALDLALSGEVKTSLQQIADSLTLRTHEVDESTRIDELFDRIVKLHYRRLLARLRSSKWEKPKFLSKQHKKPLWQDFANLLHRVQFLYTKREASSRRSVENHLRNLAPFYEAFEASEAGSPVESESLKQLIKASWHLCRSKDVAEFARRLEDSPSTTPTAKVGSAIKCLRQIEKIAAYWRIAASLVATSQTYAPLFQSKLQMHFLTPYSSVPTAIGYETWATSCHVHAEVQLAVHYDLLHQSSHITETNIGSPESVFRQPRVIGTSKWLCYLCFLFLRSHGRYVPANTHGRLYDQWTVPDLAEFGGETRTRYRNIVDAMDKEVLRETGSTGSAQAEEPGLVRWRAEPMTSRQNLLNAESVD